MRWPACGCDVRLQWRDGSKQMPLDDILQKFAEDLAAKGKVKSAQAAMGMNRCAHPAALVPVSHIACRLDFAMIIMDNYLPYPLPTSLLPFNYCALPKLFPGSRVLQQAADWLCPMR